MKRLLKLPVAALLALFARAVIRKYRPTIVMITGSVGKTSTKDAVAAALSDTFYLRASEKSYNSEFGVPLTIIGAKNPWESPSAWLRVFKEALMLLLFPAHYPKLLVLEVGADRPGDLARILRIATPDAVVVTRLPDVPVHVEAYAGPEAVREEEFAPAYALPSGAPLILSADDGNALRMATRRPVTVSTFGFAPADVQLSNPSFFSREDGTYGMQAEVLIGEEKTQIVVAGALGRPQLYAPAAAIALARVLGLSTEEALKGLAGYVPPPGRARILPGIHNSLIIDDSYNSSPDAVVEALSSLELIPNRTRRIAVLGDMLELGRYSKSEHERIGALVAGKVEVLVTVGGRARAMRDAALAAGMQEAYSFDTSDEAAEALLDMVQEGDVVLVKGSQSIRTERVAAALLETSEDREKLVRQEKEWRRR